jgi:hypothetical protein
MAHARAPDAGGRSALSQAEEELAQRLATQGREQLTARLRAAFDQAAARYPDTLVIDPEALEQMVQSAADRADGVLWRRALAAAAREELGLELGQALVHPAVERAQELAGAPPYHPSTASGHRQGAGPDEIAAALVTEAQSTSTAPQPHGEPEAELAPQAIRLPAVHLGGIGNLAKGEASLELRFSDTGLDIVRTESSTTLGRLEWREIEAIETPRSRGRRRRRTRAQLLIRTARGEAHFEIPGVSESELRGYVEPLFAAGKS